MEEKLLESYLEQISEQVLDDNKIVTYKSLSKTLGIHVNTAKQLLYVFLIKEKSKNDYPLSATYLVAGKVIDGSFNITIVNESDLKEAFAGFIEVTSEHVYSIQKAKTLKDLNVLGGVDKDISKSKSCSLVIKCPKAGVKTKKELKKKPESHEDNNKRIIKEALAPTKEPTKASPKKTSPKGSEKVQGSKKPTGNISNFFSKGVQKPVKDDGKQVGEKKIEEERKKEIEKKKEEAKKIEEERKKEVEKKKEEEKKIEVEKKKQEKKTPEKKKPIKEGIKRKRIQILSDSEDSDSNEDENHDINIEENSPPPPTPPIVNLEEKEDPEEVIPRNKRKKRKVIDKTIMNEDGYLETKKEVVLETDSENEIEEKKEEKKGKEKEEVEKTKKSQGSTGPKKQATLFTFFKKN